MSADRAIFGFPEYQPQAQRLAVALQAPCHNVEVHHFPDGESKVRLREAPPAHAIFCRSLNDPNDKLIELMLAVETAREQGVQQVTLVAPYLCYMRQDTAFNSGEAVSQRIVGRYLAGLLDTLITVDPHLHRVQRLEQAVPADRAVALSAATPMSAFIADQFHNPLLAGPDAESEQWVRTVAQPGSFDHLVGKKTRTGDRAVQIEFPAQPVDGRDVVLVDDIASTGKTLVTAAQRLYDAGARSVSALITHALFADSAEEQMRAAGISNLWSTDSISHPTNRIELAHLLSRALDDTI